MKHQSLLAIDYGTKRIGLAVNQLSLAEPLLVLSPPDGGVIDHKWAIQEIKKICQERKVERVILGLSENGMAERTKGFGRQLQTETGLPIDYFDETLSSQIVEKKIRESGMKQSRRRSEPIDHYAAAEILQGWLDTKGF